MIWQVKLFKQITKIGGSPIKDSSVKSLVTKQLPSGVFSYQTSRTGHRNGVSSDCNTGTALEDHCWEHLCCCHRTSLCKLPPNSAKEGLRLLVVWHFMLLDVGKIWYSVISANSESRGDWFKVENHKNMWMISTNKGRCFIECSRLRAHFNSKLVV